MPKWLTLVFQKQRRVALDIRFKPTTQKTNRWMAPEIIDLDVGFGGHARTSEPKYPFKCDVYSFAMVCYELLTAYEPFFEETSFIEIKKSRFLWASVKNLPDHCPPLLKALSSVIQGID